MKQIITVGIIIILCGTASYGAGVLVRREANYKPPRITERALPVVATSTLELGKPVDSIVIASKTGTKYHFPWCSGAKRINDNNKITFKNTIEARKAGYTPANNCKGLK